MLPVIRECDCFQEVAACKEDSTPVALAAPYLCFAEGRPGVSNESDPALMRDTNRGNCMQEAFCGHPAAALQALGAFRSFYGIEGSEATGRPLLLVAVPEKTCCLPSRSAFCPLPARNTEALPPTSVLRTDLKTVARPATEHFPQSAFNVAY